MLTLECTYCLDSRRECLARHPHQKREDTCYHTWECRFKEHPEAVTSFTVSNYEIASEHWNTEYMQVLKRAAADDLYYFLLRGIE